MLATTILVAKWTLAVSYVNHLFKKIIRNGA